jgi:hypothetical protein
MSAQSEGRLIELTGLAMGMWKRRQSPNQTLYMLVNPGLKIFVLLCDQRVGHHSNSAGVFIGARSPFTSTLFKNRRCVFAFEVHHDGVEGLDYSNPLLQPGRLVIEARGIRKREFSSIEDAVAYYVSPASPVKHTPPSTPQPSRAPAITAIAQPKSAKSNLLHKLHARASPKMAHENGVAPRMDGPTLTVSSHAPLSTTPTLLLNGNGNGEHAKPGMQHVRSAPAVAQLTGRF